MLTIEKEGRRFKVTWIRGQTPADVTGFYTTDAGKVTEVVQKFLGGRLGEESISGRTQAQTPTSAEAHHLRLSK